MAPVEPMAHGTVVPVSVDLFYVVASTLNTPEIKICRLVTHLIDRENFGMREVARELMKRELMNKQGEIKWSHFVVQRIYTRWKGKL